MKPLILFTFLLTLSVLKAQTVIEAQTITSTVPASDPPFTNVEYLGFNITAGVTTSLTEFAYTQVNASFVGYVGMGGILTGTITHTFGVPTSVSQILLWNAYYEYESFMNSSVKDAQLIFKDEFNNVITSQNVSFTQPTLTNLTAEVVNLTSEVLNVTEVDFVINSLWGGNNISMRRLVYAGNGLLAGVEEVNKTDKKLLKIVDLAGRTVTYKSNMILIYIYDDGSVERIYRMD